jgi:hypothetical protein
MTDNDPRHEQLYLAISRDDETTSLSLLRAGVSPNGEYNDHTHLFLACMLVAVPIVSRLLELGADANKTTDYAMTPLGIAAIYNQEVLELLVVAGHAQVDKQDWRGRTALHYSANYGKLEPSKYLVACGCTVDIVDYQGHTPLNISEQHPEVAQFLTSASSLITDNDYIALVSLCAPFTPPFLSLNIARQLRYSIILAVHHARRLIDAHGHAAPVLPFLRRLAAVPSADNSTPNTESQVFRRILTFVGTGFD